MMKLLLRHPTGSTRDPQQRVPSQGRMGVPYLYPLLRARAGSGLAVHKKHQISEDEANRIKAGSGDRVMIEPAASQEDNY
jgi:hypothetical protein